MPPDLIQPLILLFLVAVGVAGYELRASLEPPVCPQCVHCRLLAAEKRREEERVAQWRSPSVLGADERDEEDAKRR